VERLEKNIALKVPLQFYWFRQAGHYETFNRAHKKFFPVSETSSSLLPRFHTTEKSVFQTGKTVLLKMLWYPGVEVPLSDRENALDTRLTHVSKTFKMLDRLRFLIQGLASIFNECTQVRRNAVKITLEHLTK